MVSLAKIDEAMSTYVKHQTHPLAIKMLNREDEIPQDILEMVGAHFVTALENVTNLESLEKTSEELRKSNEFSLNLIEQSPHPILVTNREGTITHVNRALQQLTGYSSSELIGHKTPYPWWTDQKPKQIRGGDAKTTFKATGESFEEEFRKKNKLIS